MQPQLGFKTNAAGLPLKRRKPQRKAGTDAKKYAVRLAEWESERELVDAALEERRRVKSVERDTRKFPKQRRVDRVATATLEFAQSYKPIAGLLFTAGDDHDALDIGLDFLGVFKLDTAHPEANGRPHYSTASGWHLLYSAEGLRVSEQEFAMWFPAASGLLPDASWDLRTEARHARYWVAHGWLLQGTFCPDSTSHRAFFATDLGVPVGDQLWRIRPDPAYARLESYGYQCQVAKHDDTRQQHSGGRSLKLTVSELSSAEVVAAEQTIAETVTAAKEEAFAQARRAPGLQITIAQIVNISDGKDDYGKTDPFGIKMQISEEGMKINASRICGRHHWPLVKGVFALNQPFKQDVECPVMNGWPHYSTVAGAHLYRSRGGRWVLSTDGFATPGGLVQWKHGMSGACWTSAGGGAGVVGGAAASESDRTQRIGRHDIAEDVPMRAGTCIVASFEARQAGEVPQGERAWHMYENYLPIHPKCGVTSGRDFDGRDFTSALLVTVTELAEPKMDELCAVFRALEEDASIRAATARAQAGRVLGFRIGGLHDRSREMIAESWEEPLRGVFKLDPDLPEYNGRPHYSTAAGGHLFFDWHAWRLSIVVRKQCEHCKCLDDGPAPLFLRAPTQTQRHSTAAGYYCLPETRRQRRAGFRGSVDIHWSDPLSELYHFSEEPKELRAKKSFKEDENGGRRMCTELECFDAYAGESERCAGLQQWDLANNIGDIQTIGYLDILNIEYWKYWPPSYA
jgi:hypothetical protein